MGASERGYCVCSWIYTDQLCHMLEKNGHQRWFHVACTAAALTWALMRGRTRAWERGYCVRTCRDTYYNASTTVDITTLSSSSCYQLISC